MLHHAIIGIFHYFCGKFIPVMQLNKNTNTVFWCVLTLCAITFLPFLGDTLFNTKGEPREAIVAFSMIEQGNWILPESCGGDIPYKPPFLAWLIALFSSLTGSVSEYTSRLPSALALIAMTIVGCRFFANRSTPTKALFTALITITAFEVERAGMACRVDMVLTAFMVMAMYSLFRYFEKGHKSIPILAILLMSCAVLTKGPIGMLLPCLVMGIFRLIVGDRFFPLFFRLSAIGISALILPMLWYITAYNQGGDEFLALALEENFGRLTGTMSYDSHVKPLYYNFITVLAGYAPYTLLALFAIFSIKWKGLSYRFHSLWLKIRSMEPLRLFSLTAIIVIFSFYCIPESKRSVYLLPIYPFLAYFIAELVVWMSKKAPRIINIYGTTMAVVSILVAVAFLSVRMDLIPSDIFSGRHADQQILMLNALSDNYLGFNWIWYFIAIITAIGFFRIKSRRKPLLTFFATLITTLTLYWSMFGIYQPAILNTKSDFMMAQQIEQIAPDQPIYSFINDRFMRFYTINFYLGDRVKLFEIEQPSEGLILIGDGDVTTFQNRHRDINLTPLINSEKRSCDHRQSVTLYRFSE